jgi:hypothetical protein
MSRKLVTAYRIVFPVGIQVVRGEVLQHDPTVLWIPGDAENPGGAICDNWYLDFEEAKEKAEKKRARILRRMRKEMKVLKGMDLEKPKEMP